MEMFDELFLDQFFWFRARYSLWNSIKYYILAISALAANFYLEVYLMTQFMKDFSEYTPTID